MATGNNEQSLTESQKLAAFKRRLFMCPSCGERISFRGVMENSGSCPNSNHGRFEILWSGSRREYFAIYLLPEQFLKDVL